MSDARAGSRGKTGWRRGRQTAALACQVQAHRRARDAHLSELAEDYVEVIAELIETEGEARVVDIARRFGVSQVTVTQTIGRLQRAGLVETKPYRSIFLTGAGRGLAKRAGRRHAIVVDFLLALGIGEHSARVDAEGIEHHVSRETLRAFERFLQRRSA